MDGARWCNDKQVIQDSLPKASESGIEKQRERERERCIETFLNVSPCSVLLNDGLNSPCCLLVSLLRANQLYWRDLDGQVLFSEIPHMHWIPCQKDKERLMVESTNINKHKH